MKIAEIVLYGNPVTKKNSPRIVYIRGHASVRPSAQFERYQKGCLKQIRWGKAAIDYPVNMRYLFYMGSRRRVDTTNLKESLDDILVKAGILLDDNCTIVASHDGSQVLYDKENPRVEIEIKEKVGYVPWSREVWEENEE